MPSLMIQWILTSSVLLGPVYLYVKQRISPMTFRFSCSINFIIAVFLPILYHCSLDLQRGVLYLHFLDQPKNLETLKDLNFYELNGRNFYVNNNGIQLGVWHLLPESLTTFNILTEEEFDVSFREHYPIVFYLHGNIGSRATSHRLELYRLLTSMDFHVVTFDYRCYGDSTYSEPYEDGMVSDALKVYKWLLSVCGNCPIFVWGHSLGTGLTTHMIAELSNMGHEPKGVILEAPFPHMPAEIEVHPFGTFFRVLPWYDLLFVQHYYTNGEDFNSAKYILQFDSPVLILHAEDDGIIPELLGRKLYQVSRNGRTESSGPVTMLSLPAHQKYGHKYICRSDEAMNTVREFVKQHVNKTYNSQIQTL